MLKPYQTRRFFELSLTEMAKMMGTEPKSFRLGFKFCLRLLGYIRSSTNEIREETLKGMAEKIRKYLEPPPPDYPY